MKFAGKFGLPKRNNQWPMVGLTRFMKCFGCQREIVDG
jgi:hypothetical protein